MSREANIYPEVGAGGYTRVAGTVEFYLRVASLLPPNAVVLDLGAGRGRLHESSAAHTLQNIIDIPSRVSRFVGADVDAAVLENQQVSERVIIDPNAPLPFADGEFDLVLSDWVLEHIEHPQSYADEVYRILKPNGWFCARTPNKWGLTGILSRSVPTNLKKRLVAGQAGARDEDDVFPTFYLMNTLTNLRTLFPQSQWNDCSYILNAEPPYVSNPLLIHIISLYWRLVPEVAYTNIMCFKQKK